MTIQRNNYSAEHIGPFEDLLTYGSGMPEQVTSVAVENNVACHFMT